MEIAMFAPSSIITFQCTQFEYFTLKMVKDVELVGKLISTTCIYMCQNFASTFSDFLPFTFFVINTYVNAYIQMYTCTQPTLAQHLSTPLE